MLGRNLKILRKKNNLSQEDLAGSLSVSRQAVCLWETGERTPKVSMLMSVSKIFGVSLDQIVNGKLVSQDNRPMRKKLT